MTTTTGIKAQQIPGMNKYRAVIDYQGTRLECSHKHATIHSARSCLDLFTQVKALRAEKAAQAAEENPIT